MVLVDLELAISTPPGPPGPMTLPFLAGAPPPDRRSGAAKNVLIGRRPFFEWFDVHFRMGYTTDLELGKWTLREVTKKRPAEIARKGRVIPPPDR